MKFRMMFISFIFITQFAFGGVQPIDLTREVVQIVDQKIDEVNDEFSYIVHNLDFRIDSEDLMPGARSGWINGVPTIIFTSSLLDVVFYTSELSTLTMFDSKWNNCLLEYSAYLGSSYMDMMTQREENVQLSPLIPPEKFGNACEGIERYYPFSGNAKVIRDQSAKDSIAFIYLHELSHLFYRHSGFNTKNMSDSQKQTANCIMRKQEKDADILAARKLVKFDWARSALDVTVWLVMFNTGVIETSRNSTLNHPTAVERMSYTLDEIRSTLIISGGTVGRELSDTIDEAEALVKKVDRQLGAENSLDQDVLTCDD